MANSINETTEQELVRLKIEHADVFNNPAVRAIANWRDPLDYLAQSQPEQSEEQYVNKAKAMIPGFVRLMNRLDLEERNVSDSYKR